MGPLSNKNVPKRRQLTASQKFNTNQSPRAKAKTKNVSKQDEDFSSQKQLMDLLLEQYALSDLQIISERLIKSSSQRLVQYAIYMLAKSFYCRGNPAQARTVLESNDDKMLNSKAKLLYVQCLYDLGLYTKIEIFMLGKPLNNLVNIQENPITQSLPNDSSRFSKNELPFALRLLAFSLERFFDRYFNYLFICHLYILKILLNQQCCFCRLIDTAVKFMSGKFQRCAINCDFTYPK